MVGIWNQIELLVLGKRHVVSCIDMVETGTGRHWDIFFDGRKYFCDLHKSWEDINL